MLDGLVHQHVTRSSPTTKPVPGGGLPSDWRSWVGTDDPMKTRKMLRMLGGNITASRHATIK
jgi:hypothetical protein